MDMVMSWIFTGIVLISIVYALILGTGSELSAAVAQGAQSAVTLTISLAGSTCLWSGIAELMERIGLSDMLAKLLHPLLGRLFPSTRKHPGAARDLSANVCANILGLGNAATPMGIRAAKKLRDPTRPHVATNELCRLVVLNTASIQLIPANVAAIRASLGSRDPFDLLPAVWVTSLLSVTAGLLAAWILGRLWKT